MCSHDEALLAAAASKVDLWHLPPPMLITEFPQLNIAQHPQSWSLNFTLPQSLNLFRPPTQAVAWWNSLWSIQIPKTCGQVERYDKVWQQVLCQWKCGNFRSCRVLVRFPDPPYDVTFKSVGEPDKWAFFFCLLHGQFGFLSPEHNMVCVKTNAPNGPIKMQNLKVHTSNTCSGILEYTIKRLYTLSTC